MWVVLREINEYGQDGAYFVAAFDEKPTFKDVKKLLPDESDDVLGKLTRGGGRHDVEDQWYLLHEVTSGEAFRC